MIFSTILIISVLVLCSGCGNTAARRDRSELEGDAAQKAARLVKNGKAEEGARVLEEALLQDPLAARIHLELAIVLHESEKDFLGAAYHYRQYLRLRPDSQKRRMIEDRIRAATRLLAAGANGTDGATALSMDALEKENARLEALNRKLEVDLKMAMDARRVVVNRPASNQMTGAKTGSPVTAHGGFRHYTVQRGDSLSSIAIKMYKDHNKWEEIYEANRKELENSNDLKIGQVLVIP